MASLTTENYVKAIYQLSVRQPTDKGGVIGTGAIAQKLAVSPGTVTAMLKTLRDAELVEYAPYEGVKLTPSGEKLALRVLRRHRLIELFLSHTLELSWDEVHEEAENMEHAASDRLVNRIDEYLGFPKTDPHGDPIPQSDGTVQPFQGQSLTDWPTGETFRLIRVLDQSSDFLRFLTNSGLALSAVGQVIDRQSLAATMTVEVHGEKTVLSDNVAEKLIVVAT